MTMHFDQNKSRSLCIPSLSNQYFDNDLNQNSLLVKRQNDNPSPGAVTRGNLSLALTREVIKEKTGGRAKKAMDVAF